MVFPRKLPKTAGRQEVKIVPDSFATLFGGCILQYRNASNYRAIQRTPFS